MVDGGRRSSRWNDLFLSIVRGGSLFDRAVYDLLMDEMRKKNMETASSAQLIYG